MAFQSDLKSTILQLLNKKKHSQTMKQELCNGQYVVPHHIVNPSPTDYSKLCGFPPNYMQSFAIFPQNQLYTYCPQWTFGQVGQSYVPKINDLTIVSTYGWSQAAFPTESKSDSLHIHKTNETYEDESEEESERCMEIDDQPKNQSRLNRIKHITELNKNRVMKKGKKNFTSYYWNIEENKRYLQFLKAHPGVFDLSVSEKKNMRVNVMMSKKIKSRTPQQCHSHHQKMMKKYGTVEKLLQKMSLQGCLMLQGQKIERDQVKDQVKQELNHDNL